MTTPCNVDVVLEIFRTIEARDTKRFAALCHSDLELHWPPSLPYGGIARGDVSAKGVGWGGTWSPLQPTEAERQMDPRVVAASGDEVVVLWRQRGVSPAGDRVDSPVLGLYFMRDGKLARGQMFYFDTAEVASFLVNARVDAMPNDRDADRK